MEQNEIRFRKRRDLSDVLSATFDFLKQEAKPLSRLIAIYVLPFLLLYAGGQVYLQRNVLSQFNLNDPDTLMANIGPFYLNMFVFMCFGIFIQSLLMGAFFTYIKAYIEKGKNNFQLQDISGDLFTNSLIVLGANIVIMIMAFFGMLFCIIPGIFLANTFSLVMFIVIYERRGLGDALSRSWKLVMSQWGTTFGINILAILIVYAVSFVIQLPTMAMGIGKGFLSAMNETSAIDFPNWYWVYMGISTIITTVLLVIPFSCMAFQYFNLKELNEPTPPPMPTEEQ